MRLSGSATHRGAVSLKVRLIAVLCAFVIVALAATDAITYTSFRSYAVGQLDQQLFKSANLVLQHLDDLGGSGDPLGGPGRDLRQPGRHARAPWRRS